jgi:dihydropteroate synthase
LSVCLETSSVPSNASIASLRHPSGNASGDAAGDDRGWTLTLREGRVLRLGERPLVMGIVNLTPDSFSDGGALPTPEAAVERALELAADGADLLDLGAESTRPGGGVYGGGAATVDAEEEIRRCLPVLEALRSRTALPISVDTRKAAVARAALAAGADLINDVSALEDPGMGEVIADAGCPVVLMHSRGELATMQAGIAYDDVVAEVRNELGAALAAAVATGIDERQVVLDPGIGFGKTADHNLTLLARIDALAGLGRPLLVGASRKSFLGAVTGREVGARLAASLAAAAWSAARGVAILRVHDVAETVDVLRTWKALTNGLEAAR